ncbi:MAG: hypothetical protein ACKJSG_07590 [Lentisphaeria bacterium]
MKKRRFLKIAVCLGAMAVCPMIHAERPCRSFKSVSKARGAENACHSLETPALKINCLECISEWWYHVGGIHVDYNPYTEITRIIRLQLELDPTDVDLISELAFFIYGIESTGISTGRLADYSDHPIEIIDEFSAENQGIFAYSQSLMQVPILVVRNSHLASDDSRRRYYAVLKRLHSEAATRWRKVDHDDWSIDERELMAKKRDFVGGFLERFKEFDTEE